jgi:SAM-dependent methyltransferase
MIGKVIRYYKNYGFRKTLARSFLKLSQKLESEKGIPASNTQEVTSVNILALFKEKIKNIENPRILELGSRAVTKEALRYMLELNFPHEYTGLDIHEGPNVDVVCDAHEISSIFPHDHFDVVMSKAVFEHLAMPWKVVLEINKILKQRGLLFINSLQTYPLHEKPWDFWRFSDEAWKILLNRWTGYEIIYSNMEFPCKVVPEIDIQTWEMNHEAYLNSNVLARKTKSYDRNYLRWEIKIRDIIESSYPKQEF